MSNFTLDTPHLTTDQRLLAESRLGELYDGLKASWPGFIEREGQVTLMRMTLETLLGAKTATHNPTEGSNLGAFEAGTGTGKTIAYCLAAIVASEVLGKTVVVSTATVALQEQLFRKDLPLLAKFIPNLTYDLIKGRSRYVCKSRLEAALNGEPNSDMMWDDDSEAGEAADAAGPARSPIDSQTMVWMKKLSESLDRKAWNGELDELKDVPSESDWRTIQADGNACHGARCAHFKECAFYLSRSRARAAKLQIANHALVLSALASDSTLFDPAETLFVFDEGHHLPDIANDQFASQIRLGFSKKVFTAFRKELNTAVKALPPGERPDLSAVSRTLDECRATTTRLLEFIRESDAVTNEKPVLRFNNGYLNEDLSQESGTLASKVRSLLGVAEEVRGALTQVDESMSSKEKEGRYKTAAALQSQVAKVRSIYELFTSWATHDRIPLAKWIQMEPTTRDFEVSLCASPLTGSSGLTKGLWRQVAAGVVTSATITSCGSFEFFLRLSGLGRFKNVRTAVMPSPFDYPKQGRLRIPKMRCDPKSPGFSEELCRVIPSLLREHKYGQLVLFTSRRQMEMCYQALPDDIQPYVLVQNSMARGALLQKHHDRISRGELSIIFGLQSLGEGLDLPGRLCEHVVIDKLPFTPPSSPVDEALSEWLATQNRDSFAEIQVPKTSMRLAQWVGRAVRTVKDQSTITICDTRLTSKAYGRRILAGLPNFARI